MGAGAYLRTRLGLLLRSRVVLGMLVLVAVICVGSSLLPGTTGFCPELYHRRRALFDDAVKSGVISPQTSEQANLLLEYGPSSPSPARSMTADGTSTRAPLSSRRRSASPQCRLSYPGPCGPFRRSSLPACSASTAQAADCSHRPRWKRGRHE